MPINEPPIPLSEEGKKHWTDDIIWDSDSDEVKAEKLKRQLERAKTRPGEDTDFFDAVESGALHEDT